MKKSLQYEKVYTGFAGILMVILSAIISIPVFIIIFITSIFYVSIMLLFSPPGVITLLLLTIIYLIFTGGCV